MFRFVEFSGGVSSNPILANEAYQLGLDALPMLVALLTLNAVHPSMVLKGLESSFPRTWRPRQHRDGEPALELGNRGGKDAPPSD